MDPLTRASSVASSTSSTSAASSPPPAPPSTPANPSLKKEAASVDELVYARLAVLAASQSGKRPLSAIITDQSLPASSAKKPDIGHLSPPPAARSDSVDLPPIELEGKNASQ